MNTTGYLRKTKLIRWSAKDGDQCLILTKQVLISINFYLGSLIWQFAQLESWNLRKKPKNCLRQH